MTTPTERTRAVIELGIDVQTLAPYLHGKSEKVLIPRELLRRLHGWLRHYPAPSELWATAEKAPELWSDKMGDTQPQRCKHGDPFCPCQDGLQCHYEGPNPMVSPYEQQPIKA